MAKSGIKKFWEKVKSLYAKKNPNHSFYIYASIITAIAALYICFFSTDSLLRWIGAKRELGRLNDQILYYHKENEKLDKKIERLSTERDTLEEFARENFLFAAPGEDVYVVEEKQ